MCGLERKQGYSTHTCTHRWDGLTRVAEDLLHGPESVDQLAAQP